MVKLSSGWAPPSPVLLALQPMLKGDERKKIPSKRISQKRKFILHNDRNA